MSLESLQSKTVIFPQPGAKHSPPDENDYGGNDGGQEDEPAEDSQRYNASCSSRRITLGETLVNCEPTERLSEEDFLTQVELRLSGLVRSVILDRVGHVGALAAPAGLHVGRVRDLVVHGGQRGPGREAVVRGLEEGAAAGWGLTRGT